VPEKLLHFEEQMRQEKEHPILDRLGYVEEDIGDQEGGRR
jgi:hypothetical protein